MIFFQKVKITRHDNDPYLDRTIIFRCKWFSILWHKFVGSDDECHHDHPWPFVTFIIKGGYWEYVTHKDGTTTKKWYPPGSVLYRPADWTHRIEIDPKRPPSTLVFHIGKTRRWGFYTRFGWLHHRDYVWSQHCQD